MDVVRIIWEDWKDPFLAAVNEHKEKGWMDSYDHLDKPGQMGVYQGPVVMGAAGMIPLNELNCPSRNFRLYVGHTSFNLSQRVANKMVGVPGVEIFRIWTRYRFWLGVGRAFDSKQVKNEILAVVRKQLAVPSTPSQMALLQAELSSKHKYWAIFTYPSGKLGFVGGDDRRVVEAQVDEARPRVRSCVTSWKQSHEEKD